MLRERDSDELLRRIMLNVIQKNYDKEPIRNVNIKTLIDLYHRRSYLTNNEILELLRLYTEEEAQQEMDLSFLEIGNFPRV
jgi:hypothetical protein